MPTLAIVGAGPQLGAAIARVFGAQGYRIALISRNREHLDNLTSVLSEASLNVASFVADVRDHQALSSALLDAEKHFGSIDVLEYSPLPGSDYLQPVLETTREQVQAAFEFSVHGPMTAVETVLPGMRKRGSGSLLFTSGGSSLVPASKVAGTSIAMAGEAAYLTMLHQALAPENLHVSHLVVPVRIGPGETLGDPTALAEQLWRLHADRDQFRVVVGE
ncbi:SDR family NAD(P)-dependent oxidoreductase [Actinacidiphila oryziradicis]|uniref:SDR family NAD(P)-dependent oxidoreductase n=1 Tax=Actinacidiphila oryziradicis TaxID=2571141 RepID=A0A4U0SIS2_9ACTN|nr:SDR family NAD(P)-dependent oxidoreductase [Actinacidiphila oryziradicis]TKA00185.1 SDR family NAD(P)-dependent oxidoreductase [Actinacidiphila oryziradicis]